MAPYYNHKTKLGGELGYGRVKWFVHSCSGKNVGFERNTAMKAECRMNADMAKKYTDAHERMKIEAIMDLVAGHDGIANNECCLRRIQDHTEKQLQAKRDVIPFKEEYQHHKNILERGYPYF